MNPCILNSTVWTLCLRNTATEEGRDETRMPSHLIHGSQDTVFNVRPKTLPFLAAAELKAPVASLTTGVWCTEQWQYDDWGDAKNPWVTERNGTDLGWVPSLCPSCSMSLDNTGSKTLS